MKFDIIATINTTDHEYDDVPYQGNTLDDIWEQIKREYPDVTSVVFVFSSPA